MRIKQLYYTKYFLSFIVRSRDNAIILSLYKPCGFKILSSWPINAREFNSTDQIDLDMGDYIMSYSKF